mmetsp:Transcript_22270/g.62029  ORF Transcript_22270/g.62029 Transcript_22270/m.62029 type:complete len:476 (+) Transcript_22270:198-1625(+)
MPSLVQYCRVPKRIQILFAIWFASTYTANVFCVPRPSAIHCVSPQQLLVWTSRGGSIVPNTTDTGETMAMNATTDETTSSEETIGGGDINEKVRRCVRESSRTDSGALPPSPSQLSRYNPSQHRSHLMHAIEGLNRYPNYLSRWNEHDVETLERDLERTLLEVREQKSKIAAQRDAIRLALWEFFKEHPEWNEFSARPESWDDVRSNVLDPRAARAIFRSNFFRRSKDTHKDSVSLEDVLSGTIPVELDAGFLQEWMDEEMFDVYSFPLLSETFCRKLCLYASTAMAFLESSLRSSDVSINSYVYKNLDLLGLSWLNDLVFHLIVRPISAQLYKDTELLGGDLDWRQGFVAAYSSSPTTSKPRQRLVPHTDDAEITLNLCFGDQFTGGDLRFWGVRGDQTAGKFVGEYQPEIGRAVIHSGRHLHEVTEITSGNRFAYIQWARSWGSTRREVCPCCWLNGRRMNGLDFCVCGTKWN